MTTYNPSADARVTERYPDSNFGGETKLVADNEPPSEDSYLTFTIQGAAGVVSSAVLRLYSVSESSVSGPDLYVVSPDWSEGDITWNNRPMPSGDKIASADTIHPDTWVELDVTSIVTGDGTYSFMVAGTSADDAIYRSRESDHPPELVVTSELATNTPVSTDTPVSADTPVSTDTPEVDTPTPEPTHHHHPTKTPTETDTPEAATDTPEAATNTPEPPTATDTDTDTATAEPPTATVTGTVTPAPPTATATQTPDVSGGPLPPTATPSRTSTSAPPTPTATLTSTSVPPTATPTRTSTPVLPTATASNTATAVPATRTPTASPTIDPTATAAPTATATPPSGGGGSTTIVAAGDVACDPSNTGAFNGGNGTATECHMKQTAALIGQINPSVVLMLGDAQYETGTTSNFNQSYNPTWGQYKGKTRAVAGGSHDFYGSGDYATYFGPAAGTAGQNWYSFDVNGWHIIVLNSYCSTNGNCSAEQQWLANDLANNKSACTMAAWHEPRYSSGYRHGNQPGIDWAWDMLVNANAELVLVGHEHEYERFGPIGTSDNSDPNGVVEIVTGTGGKSLETAWGTIQPNSLVRNRDTYGVLKLVLSNGSLTYTFVPEAGKSFTDSGTITCH